MKLNQLERDEIRLRLFHLMDYVALQVQKNPNIDEFLDTTTVFQEWDNLFSDIEYPIFLMAVLNNIRRDSIVNVILDAITGTTGERIPMPTNDLPPQGHPFC